MDYKLHNDRPTPVNGIPEEIVSVSCGNRHTLVLTDHGTVYGMGTNKKYELGLLNN
jgi:alpha-tubulin suppressor-like RCC1 family protein